MTDLRLWLFAACAGATGYCFARSWRVGFPEGRAAGDRWMAGALAAMAGVCLAAPFAEPFAPFLLFLAACLAAPRNREA